MNDAAIEKIANAVLYEGYMLYPYRPSAIKNRQRWNFGIIYPKAYAERSAGADSSLMQTECLIRGSGTTEISMAVRFLQSDNPDEAANVVERRMEIPPVPLAGLFAQPLSREFHFARAIRAHVEVRAIQLDTGLFRLQVRILNLTECACSDLETRQEILPGCMLSTHSILYARSGEFLSLMDPPAEVQSHAAECKNIGTWPVLVGEEASRCAMLSSPIILYDNPQVAPESPGDLFDGTEMDEILALRILTLTDEEKSEIRAGDGRARAVLERTESLPPEHFLKLHGVLRGCPRQPSDGDSRAEEKP